MSKREDNPHEAPVCGACAKDFGWIELLYDEKKLPCNWCETPTNNRNKAGGVKVKKYLTDIVKK